MSNRRSFLRQVFAGIGAFSLPNVLKLRAAAATQAGGKNDTSLIVLWQDGGPSHFETFDPKPTAPAEIRGDLGAIATRHPGVQFCEVLPRLAQMADRFTIIRSLHQASSAHVSATHTFVTGYDRTGVIAGPPDNPDLCVVINRMRSGRDNPLPEYAGLPEQPRGGSAYLGSAYGPLSIRADPSKPDFKVDNLKLNAAIPRERFDQRSHLLTQFDRLRRSLDTSGQMDVLDEFQRKAIDMLTGPAAARAFDLSREDPKLRERYGMHNAGQQALLARRLIESGTSFANVVMEHPGIAAPKNNVVYNWDCHAVNCHVFDDARWRFPPFDQAVSALIEDLYERGLDKKVMLVVTGEFGHTPRINHIKGTQTGIVQPGRDHWPGVYSALLAGGGSMDSMTRLDLQGTEEARVWFAKSR